MNSTQDGMASKKGGISPGAGSNIKVEDGEGTDLQKKAQTKRKADTDCENREFELTLQERACGGEKDFRRENVRQISSMSLGAPPQERLNIPEGVDVF